MERRRSANVPRNTCSNLNHRRSDPPVRHCVECGELLNANLIAQECSEEEHAKRRRARSKFCSSCGTQLITA